MIRLCDFLFALFGLLFLWPLLLLLIVLGYFDTGAPLFLQQRVGCHQKLFTLIKLRTMKKNTPSVASHQVGAAAITPYGHFLRKTKLDELPQLWNVLMGEMSLVGPRPCLPNQKELVNLRQQAGVFNYRPGITGLAQTQNIDMSTPELLTETDSAMLKSLSLKSYLGYIIGTVLGKGAGDAAR